MTIKISPRKKITLVEDSFYILDIRKLYNPRLLNNKFENVEEAKKAIRLSLGSKFRSFRIITGEFAIKHGLLFKRDDNHLREQTHVRIYKHDYPPEIMGNKQAMKYFRWKRQLEIREQKQNNP